MSNISSFRGSHEKQVLMTNAGEFAGALLTPVSAIGFVLAAWRLGADIGWTSAFPLSDGLLSHWMVWIAIGVLIQACAANLKRSNAPRTS
jgi:hypothetical protein